MIETVRSADASKALSSDLLRKLVTDDTFRARFVSDRERMLAEHDLTAEQAGALRGLDLEALDRLMSAATRVPDSAAAIGSLYI
jgi:hypothetical protein